MHTQRTNVIPYTLAKESLSCMMLIKHPEDSKVFLEEIKDPGFGSLFFLGLFFCRRGLGGGNENCQSLS